MPRKKRRDAVENRERLITAAFDLLADRDPDLSVRELALHTGLGVGTAYRHFPTHADLFRALYDAAVARMGEAMGQAPEGADAWVALADMLESVTFALADFPALRAVMRRMYDIDPSYMPAGALTPQFQDVVERAQREGALRQGVAGEDITSTALALAGLVGRPTGAERDMIKRQLVIVLDGLRARDDASPLPGVALNPDEFHVFTHRANGPAAVQE
ncbi:TetR/AcrR family transcriptional regulator [Demequina sp.]|uniref:TetR/AcrR family transcriptional regulator n=1 Tax=Demequina sp. TaxID=2050685 RepID=UPI003A865649